MPKAPTYEPGQIRPNPLPASNETANATGASFGGNRAKQIQQLGGSLQDLGRGVSNVSKALQASETRKAKSISRDSLNSATSEARTYLGEDVYRRKGKEAVDIYDEVEQKLQEIRKTHTANLQTEEQRNLFTASFDGVMNDHLNRVISFQEKERLSFEQETISAQNQSAVEEAIGARTDPQEIQKSEAIIVANTRFINKGQGAEIIDKAVKDGVNNLHGSVLSALAKDSPEAALGYLEANKDKFNPTAAIAAKEELTALARNATIRNTAINLTNSGLSFEEQLEAVDKIEDEEIAVEVRKRVKERNEVKTSINEAKKQQHVETQWDELFQDPIKFSPDIELPAAQQKQMYEYKAKAIEAWKEENGIGVAKTTDWDRWHEVMSMDDKDFLKLDIYSEVNKYHPTEFKDLVKMQRSMRKGGDEAADVFRVRNYNQQASQAIAGIKGIDATKGGKKGTRSAQYFEQFAKQIQQLAPEDRTEANVGEIIKGLLSPVDTPLGSLVPGTRYRFEVPYMDNKPDQTKYLKNSVPERLQGVDGVEYDSAAQEYFFTSDGLSHYYDPYGQYLGSQPSEAN